MEESDQSDDEYSDTEPVDMESKFMWAAEQNQLDLMKNILEENPNLINHKNDDGYTALHVASSEGNVDIVEYLLKQENQDVCNVHARTNDGWTPLHCACRWNNAAVGQLLIHNNADVNAVSNGGVTPLHAAAGSKGNREVLVLLLSNHEINPKLKTNAGDTAFDLARRTDKFASLFTMVADHVN